MQLGKKNNNDNFISGIKALMDPIPDRDENAIKNGRAKFLAQAKLIQKSPVSTIPYPRHNRWNFHFIKEVKMGTLVTILMILGLVLGSSTATVFAAQNDLPNQFLYSVKMLSEEANLSLTSNPEQKLNLQLQYSLRRIDEIQEMRDDGLLPTEAVFARLENQLNNTLGEAAKINSENIEAALLRIRERLQERLDLSLQNTSDPVLARTRAILQTRLQIVESGIADPQSFYNMARLGWDNIINTGDDNGSGNTSIQNQNKEQNQEQNQIKRTMTATPQPGCCTQTPGYQTPGAVYQTPGPGYQTPGPGYQTPGPGYQTPGPGYQTPGPGYQTPGPGYQTPGPGYQTPGPGNESPTPGDKTKEPGTKTSEPGGGGNGKKP